MFICLFRYGEKIDYSYPMLKNPDLTIVTNYWFTNLAYYSVTTLRCVNVSCRNSIVSTVVHIGTETKRPVCLLYTSRCV